MDGAALYQAPSDRSIDRSSVFKTMAPNQEPSSPEMLQSTSGYSTLPTPALQARPLHIYAAPLPYRETIKRPEEIEFNALQNHTASARPPLDPAIALPLLQLPAKLMLQSRLSMKTLLPHHNTHVSLLPLLLNAAASQRSVRKSIFLSSSLSGDCRAGLSE